MDPGKDTVRDGDEEERRRDVESVLQMIRYLEREVRRLALADAAWFAQLFRQSVIEAAADAGLRSKIEGASATAWTAESHIVTRRRPPVTPSR